MKAKKIIALLLAGVLMTSMLTGCAVNKGATVASMKNQKVTMGIANFMCRYQQAVGDDAYRNMYGEGVWTMDMGTGSTMQDFVKTQVMEQLHEYYTLQAHMDEYKVSLSDDEKQKIKDTATAFISANSRSALKEMGATQEIVEEMLTLATIQSKMQEVIYAKADTKVTDEEANMRAYTMVKLSKEGKYDDEGNYVEFTEDQQVDIRVNATTILDSVENGTELETAATNLGYEATTGTYDADDTALEEDVKKALDGLKKGAVSELIETDTAYYLVRLDEETDKEATKQNKEDIAKERQTDLYNETLEGWQENDGWKVKESKLEAIQFKNNFTQQSGEEEAVPVTETADVVETTESAE